MRDLFPRVAETSRKPRKMGVSATATRKDTAKFSAFRSAVAAHGRLSPHLYMADALGGYLFCIALRKSPSKHDENEGFSNSYTDGKQQPQGTCRMV
jgi:hypothetical protein